MDQRASVHPFSRRKTREVQRSGTTLDLHRFTCKERLRASKSDAPIRRSSPRRAEPTALASSA
jgi:hypothetical protein